MLEQFILLAQNTPRYNRGLAFFQWGITGVGIAIIILGLGLAFSKTKDPQRQTSPTVRWISLGICGVIGLGIIGYAWFGFGSL
jgi:multisubunit Na+/H+ antiporter MnhB subunit